MCKFSLPKCIPAALQILILVLALAPLAWKPGLNEQITKAKLTTKNPTTFNITHQPHAHCLDPAEQLFIHRIKPNIFAPANQLYELCITECTQKFLASTKPNETQSHIGFKRQAIIQPPKFHLYQKLDTKKPAGQIYKLCNNSGTHTNPPANAQTVNTTGHHTNKSLSKIIQPNQIQSKVRHNNRKTIGNYYKQTTC